MCISSDTSGRIFAVRENGTPMFIRSKFKSTTTFNYVLEVTYLYVGFCSTSHFIINSRYDL